MKKNYYFLAVVIASSIIANAQIVVERNGNLGIGIVPTMDSIRCELAVKSVGHSDACVYVNCDRINSSTGIKIIRTGPSYISGVDITAGVYSIDRNLPSSKNIAFYGISNSPSGNINSGRSYGVLALGGNATSGWNYGVLGSLIGTQNGAGIYGSSTSWDSGIDVGGRFAGYFRGDVKVTSDIFATNVYTSSDFRIKKDIKSIEDNCLTQLMKMNVVSFDFKQRQITSDTSSVAQNYYEEGSPILTNKHFGLIAQELKEIYPDLVVEGQDGYLSINYTELIPVLIKSIQDLKNELDDKSEKSVERKNESTFNGTQLSIETRLYQNNPNPFKEKTIIQCEISKEVASAQLYIYDMNGKQIDSMAISERGNANVVIEGGKFDAGIYLYSLIVDGMAIDTKRMILTK